MAHVQHALVTARLARLANHALLLTYLSNGGKRGSVKRIERMEENGA